MPPGRPKKRLSLEDFPKKFRRAMIRLMANRLIDNLEDGLEIAGILLEGNNKEINKRVNAEAERRFKSRLFTELNKALATRGETDYSRGCWDTKKTYCITYPCSVCEKQIEIYAGGPEENSILQHLRNEGWSHEECVQ